MLILNKRALLAANLVILRSKTSPSDKKRVWIRAINLDRLVSIEFYSIFLEVKSFLGIFVQSQPVNPRCTPSLLWFLFAVIKFDQINTGMTWLLNKNKKTLEWLLKRNGWPLSDCFQNTHFERHLIMQTLRTNFLLLLFQKETKKTDKTYRVREISKTNYFSFYALKSPKYRNHYVPIK